MGWGGGGDGLSKFSVFLGVLYESDFDLAIELRGVFILF